MRFNVIIGNPPYQRENNKASDNGKNPVYKAAYCEFIERALEVKPTLITMIVPAKWYADKQTSLARLRHMLKDEGHLENLIDYKSSADCFPNVRIVGGVCYFLYNKEYLGDCSIMNMTQNSCCSLKRDIVREEYIIRDNIGIQILEKIKSKTVDFMDSYVEASFFDIPSNEKGSTSQNDKADEPDYEILSSENNSMCIKYISRDSVLRNRTIADKEYKLIVGKLLAGGGDHPVDKNGQMKILSGIYKVNPNQVFISNYLMVMHSENMSKIINCEQYIKTKFVRFLLYLGIAGLNITADSFRYVPMQTFDMAYNDQMLYYKYELTCDEIKFVENFIKGIE